MYRASIGTCRAFDNSHVLAFSLNAMAVRDLDLRQSSNKAGKQSEMVKFKSCTDRIVSSRTLKQMHKEKEKGT